MIMKYDKDTMNSLQEAYKSISEGDDHEGKKLADAEQEKYNKKLEQAAKKAPIPKNKIVGFNKESYERRIKEAYEKTRQEYNKINKDFKGKIDKDGNAYIVDGEDTPTGNRVTVRRKYKITDEVDKKKEMEDKMKEVEDMRSLPTRMNLIKTKLRAMGLNMSHVLKGKELSEVIDYTLNEVTRQKKEMGYVVGGTKKPTSHKTPDPALDKVTKSIYAAGGKIMRSGSNQQKKVRGGPTPGGGKYLKMQQQKNQLKSDAEKRGFSNIQNYVDTMAIYGGKKNYDQGTGSGS